MSTETLPPNNESSEQQLNVTAYDVVGNPIPSQDPHRASFKVEVRRIPLSQLLEEKEREFAQKKAAAALLSPPPNSTQATPSSSSGSGSISETDSPKKRVPSPRIDKNELPKDVEVLQNMIVDLLRALNQERHENFDLQEIIDALLQRGRRSIPENPDQGTLFPEMLSNDATELSQPPTPPPLPPDSEETKPKRKSKPHGRRDPDDSKLRKEIHRIELSQPERVCPCCGKERCEIGSESMPRYAYKPAEVYIVDHQRVKYACKDCEGEVVIAPKPAHIVDRCMAEPSLQAQVIVDKYQDHLPLNRTSQRWARTGVNFSRSTLCDWMAASAERLTPLWHKLKADVLRSKVLGTDDTTVPVKDDTLDEFRYGRLWPYVGDAEHPGIVFDYTKTRARDGPAEFLKTFKGFLQADAYGGYDGIYTGSNGTIVEVGCWAHARNKAKEAQAGDPKRWLAIKAWVRALYDVEDEAKEFSSADRLRLRQEKSVPLLTSFCQWLKDQKDLILPKSPMALAINYILNQWEALNRYVTDGDLSIDNNATERVLKLIGMGRDNWLFLGSDVGGKTAAVLYSFTATCKRLGIDTVVYLTDVLERLPTTAEGELEQLLPHRWQAARATEEAQAQSAEASATPSP